METIIYAVILLCAFLAIAFNFVNINVLDKRIDEMLDEEKRQNKRIDVMEKLEQVRQAEERHDKAYIEANELFKDW